MKTWKARFVVTQSGILENAVFGAENGVFVAVGGRDADEDLGDVAVVPGLVNGHSHAFQRAIRGRTEFLDARRPDEDFWSWRTLMYQAALSLGPEAFEAVSRMAFLEMALSGITAVGEFHYVHHQQDGTPYSDPNELAHRVIRAARSVGIRITLLRVAYHRGGYGQPAGDDQRRFIEDDVETYLGRVESLASDWRSDDRVQVGMAPHSIRAVPGNWLSAIAKHADQTGRVVHIHACEQRRELEESIHEYGSAPVRVFEDLGLLGPGTTIVHGTHLEAGDAERLKSTGTTVCACPTTERNLGDGFLPAQDLLGAGVSVSLGTDSQAQIDLWSEMRLVEYHERLRAERRNVLAAAHPVWLDSPTDGKLSTADVLWPMSTVHGAHSIGLNSGQIAPGRSADFAVLDLRHPSLVGGNHESLLSDLVFSGVPAAVVGVYVGGTQIIHGSRHADTDGIVDDFRSVMSKLDALSMT